MPGGAAGAAAAAGGQPAAPGQPAGPGGAQRLITGTGRLASCDSEASGPGAGCHSLSGRAGGVLIRPHLTHY
jgi:hypothetical protein